MPDTDQDIYNPWASAEISVGPGVSTRIAGLQSAGALQISGGTLSGLDGWSSLNLNNTLSLNSASLSRFHISATGGIVVAGASPSVLDRTAIDSSTPIQINAGQLELRNPNSVDSLIILAHDEAKLRVASGAYLGGSGQIRGYGTVENDGILNMVVVADTTGKTLTLQNNTDTPTGSAGSEGGGILDVYGVAPQCVVAMGGGLTKINGPISASMLIAEDASEIRLKDQVTIGYSNIFRTQGSGKIILDGGKATGNWVSGSGESALQLHVSGNTANALDGLGMGSGHNLLLDNPTGDGSYLEARNPNSVDSLITLAHDQATLKIAAGAYLGGSGLIRGYGTVENNGILNMVVVADTAGKTLTLQNNSDSPTGSVGSEGGGILDVYGVAPQCVVAMGGGLTKINGPISASMLIAEDASEIRLKDQVTIGYSNIFRTQGSGKIILDGGKATGNWVSGSGESALQLHVSGNTANALDGLGMGSGHNLLLDDPTGDGSYLEARNGNSVDGLITLAHDQATLKIAAGAYLGGSGLIRGYGTVENNGILNMVVVADTAGKTLTLQNNSDSPTGSVGSEGGGILDVYGVAPQCVVAMGGGLTKINGPISASMLIAEDASEIRLKDQVTIGYSNIFRTQGSGKIILDGGKATGNWVSGSGESALQLHVSGNTANALDGLGMGSGHNLLLDDPTGDGSYLEARNGNSVDGLITLAHDQATLKIAAGAYLGGSGQIRGYGTVENNGLLNMVVVADTAGKTLLLRGNGFASGFAAGALGGATLEIETSVNGNSWLTVESGSRAVFGGAYSGSVTWNLDGTLEAAQGIVLTSGSIFGNGHITGLLTNVGAVISPGHSPGMLTVESFNQSGSGTLLMEIAGSEIGEHDVLRILGDAQLGGTLHIALLDGYLPGPGESFGLLYMGSNVTGQFDSLIVDGVTQPDYTWELSQKGQLLTITFVPEPSFVFLVAVALIPLASRRRTRTPRKP